MKIVLGDTLTGEAEAKWDALSGVDKMCLVRAKQRDIEAKANAAKLAALPPKPHNWSAGSHRDHREWWLKVEREREGSK